MSNPQDQPRIGRRAGKLDALNEKFVETFVHNLEPHSIVDWLPALDNQSKDDLHAAHVQVLDYMREHMTSQFDRVKHESNVVEKLNELEELILEANHSRGPRLVPHPQQVMRALRIKCKMQELERLRTEEARLHERNYELMNEMTEKINKLEQANEQASAGFKQPEETAAIIKAVPIDDYQEMADDMMGYQQVGLSQEG